MTKTPQHTDEPTWLVRRLELRRAAIAELADRVAASNQYLPSRVDTSARLCFLAQPLTEARSTCLVCDVPLFPGQGDYCWGHWDYITMVIPDDSTFGESFRDQLVADLEALRGLTARIRRPYWWGIMKGSHRCHVCDAIEGLHETLETTDGQVVRFHSVCVDHLSFPGLPISNNQNQEQS